MPSDDTEAIQAVLNGNVQRYAELVERYRVQALRLAFSLLGNYEDAQDVAQESFVSAYQGLACFRQRAQFSTWLYRIVVNKCKDFHKQRSRRPKVVASLPPQHPKMDEPGFFVDVADPSALAADHLENRELGKRLSLAIESLALKQRTAFVLHELHGLTLEEVAMIMRCRVGTVKSHLFRAMANLRDQLIPWIRERES